MAYDKPLPRPNQDTSPFWEGTRRHELLVQKCESCGNLQFYPRLYCTTCTADGLAWVRSTGKGTVASYSVIYRAPSKAFADDVPYVVALIDLEEGVRMMSNVIGCDPTTVRIGMGVEVEFEDVTEEITLPKFRPAP